MKKIFHNEKGSIKQEAKTILNMYALNDTTSKYIKIDIIIIVDLSVSHFNPVSYILDLDLGSNCI